MERSTKVLIVGALIVTVILSSVDVAFRLKVITPVQLSAMITKPFQKPPEEFKAWWYGGIPVGEVYRWDEERKLPIAPQTGYGSNVYPLALTGFVTHSVRYNITELHFELTNWNYSPVAIVRKVLVESEKGIITLVPPKWRPMTEEGKPVGGRIAFFWPYTPTYGNIHGEPEEEEIYRQDGIYIPISKPPVELISAGVSNSMIPTEIGKTFWKNGKNYKITVIHDGGVAEFLIICIEVPV